MGTYMTCYAEQKVGDEWENLGSAFDWQDYGLFGFLADVRNYSAVPSLNPRRMKLGERECGPGHEHNYPPWWLPLDELTQFDYSAEFEDLRRKGNTLPAGQGVKTTFVEFLGEHYFNELIRLQRIGADRIVFSFD